MSVTEQVYTNMTTSAPAFSSNNPFRKPSQQYTAPERQHSPSQSHGYPQQNRNNLIPISNIPPPRRSSATSQVSERGRSPAVHYSKNSTNDFDFEDDSRRNLNQSASRSQKSNFYASNSFNNPQHTKLSHSHSAQSVSIADYSESSPDPPLVVPNRRPMSTFYSLPKHSNSDQSIFRPSFDHEDEQFTSSRTLDIPKNFSRSQVPPRRTSDTTGQLHQQHSHHQIDSISSSRSVQSGYVKNFFFFFL